MRAIQIERPGGPDVLRPCERPVPVPGPGEVLIRVAAAGVNRPDVLQRAGAYPPPPDASDLPGLEVAGHIVAGDCGDSGFAPGDAICALTHGGGYAEQVVVPAAHCLPVPRGWTLAEAASLPETAFTVWSNVFDRGRLADAETLLVHGGASGIGVTAIQFARALGHRVFVTAGSDERCRACEAIGASAAINYRTQDFVAEVRRLTGERGVDLILDMVAGPYLPRDLAALADDGRIVIIALLGGFKAELPLADILRRRLTITGSTLRPRTRAYKAQVAAALRARIWPLIEAGRIRPVVHARFPLERAADAHRLMEAGEQIGKLVLEVSSPAG